MTSRIDIYTFYAYWLSFASFPQPQQQRFVTPATTPPPPHRGTKRKHSETYGSVTKRTKVVDDNNSRLTLFTNKCGNTGIIVDGQKFRKQKVRKDSCIAWRCNVNKCKSFVVTTADYSILSVDDHNHTLPSRPPL